MKSYRRISGMAAACLAAVMLLTTGCENGIPIVSEIRETESYTDAQRMILVATEKNRYQDVYGSELWDVVVDESGETFQSYLLGEIRSFLKELETMNRLADEHELELTGQEMEQLKTLTQEYYDSLTDADIAYMVISQDDVYYMYEQYHRANKLVSELTGDMNLEISDSEAKVVTVQEIKLDSDTAQSVYEQVTAEGADFLSIAREYVKDAVSERQIARGERSGTYEEVVFNLQTGEISRPIQEDDQNFVIVKCLNDYDEEATLERKQRLSLQRKNQAFKQIYDTYAAGHVVETSGSWEHISFSDGGPSTTTNFFELYHERMKY